MMNGWRSQHKHNPSGPRAAGLLDCDVASLKNSWNATAGNVSSAKCFCYPKPKHAIAALQKGFRLPVTLEVLYGLDIWKWADSKNMLQDRIRADIYPAELVENILKGQAGEVVIDQSYELFVTKEFQSDCKVKAAHYVAAKDSKFILESLGSLSALLREVLLYLEFDEPFFT